MKLVDLRDLLLGEIRKVPGRTTAELADAVGVADTAMVSRTLGNLNRDGLVKKDGGRLWYLIKDEEPADQPSDRAIAAVATLCEPTEPEPPKPALPAELLAALDETEALLRPKPLPEFSALQGIDVELAVLQRLADILCPTITEQLLRTHDRLMEIKHFEQARAA